RFGAVVFRVDRLALQRGMIGKLVAVELAVGVFLLRLVVENQNNFIGGIHDLVIVVLVLFRRDAESGENKRPVDLRLIALPGEAAQQVALVELELHGTFVPYRDLKPIAGAQRSAGNDRELLKEAAVIAGG